MGNQLDQTVINVEFESTDPITSVVENTGFAFKERPQPDGANFRVLLRIERIEDLSNEPSRVS